MPARSYVQNTLPFSHASGGLEPFLKTPGPYALAVDFTGIDLIGARERRGTPKKVIWDVLWFWWKGVFFLISSNLLSFRADTPSVTLPEFF